MLKKILTINALTLVLAVGGVSLSQTSCSQADKKEASQETDKAYNNFKTFVDNTEAGAKDVANETQEEYDQQTTKLKADYDSAVAAIDQDADKYDDARRAEIEQLRARYTTAYDAREQAWRARSGAGADTTTLSTTTTAATTTESSAPAKLGKYYKPSTPAAAMTAANARSTYEAFVQRVKQNEDRYDIDDWRNVNAEWRALDTKYDQIKSNVSGSDKAEITKEKLKYAAFKSFDKAEARGSQVGDLVTGDKAEAKAKGGGVELKQSAKNTGKDVGNAAKNVAQGAEKVGKKVGGAVKGAFKDVKEEVKGDKKD
ncbi:DUF6565 domain-containing protein [Hymenobacter sp. GOD-10R]|uniref:DUF6565 domain-containing protein n=1 Tax=Hymenobacter sp. GOD-10R TaxID=3093922 RepID=UPI002D77BAF4|nr:DUF6565 domain-containing protein [Hymenobacter sp. GOD-10R]WRQ26651.1 DUF6565 domain-containing protein [Hymenobacter sp. GOD-10R]